MNKNDIENSLKNKWNRIYFRTKIILFRVLRIGGVSAAYPPVCAFLGAYKEPREWGQKNSAKSCAYEGGYILPEIKKDTEQILTDKNIAKEFRKIKKMFLGIEDESKKELVFKIIEEVAFQKVAMKAARQEMIEKGLQTETKNASQKFIKENPAVATYDRYARSYTSNMKQLIELLPPKEKKTVSKLAALRDED